MKKGLIIPRKLNIKWTISQLFFLDTNENEIVEVISDAPTDIEYEIATPFDLPCEQSVWRCKIFRYLENNRN